MPAAIWMPMKIRSQSRSRSRLSDLSPEQIHHFKGNLEFWDESAGALITGPPIAAIRTDHRHPEAYGRRARPDP
jgi:hypothetical protein